VRVARPSLKAWRSLEYEVDIDEQLTTSVLVSPDDAMTVMTGPRTEVGQVGTFRLA